MFRDATAQNTWFMRVISEGTLTSLSSFPIVHSYRTPSTVNPTQLLLKISIEANRRFVTISFGFVFLFSPHVKIFPSSYWLVDL